MYEVNKASPATDIRLASPDPHDPSVVPGAESGLDNVG